MSFLISIADYGYTFLCATFGVFAVVSKRINIVVLMVAMILLTWPMFLLEGHRNKVLTVFVPSILAVIFATKWSRHRKLAFFAASVFAMNYFMLISISYRNTGYQTFFENWSFENQKHSG